MGFIIGIIVFFMNVTLIVFLIGAAIAIVVKITDKWDI